MPFGISKLGSSSSDSGGGGGGVAVCCGANIGPREASGVGVAGLEETGVVSTASPCFFSMVGGRSVAECLPVVHGGMERNSSKVRTRGLQHFHPNERLSQHKKVLVITNNFISKERSTYPSVLRGRLEVQDGTNTPPQGLCTSCHKTDEHIFAPS